MVLLSGVPPAWAALLKRFSGTTGGTQIGVLMVTLKALGAFPKASHSPTTTLDSSCLEHEVAS